MSGSIGTSRGALRYDIWRCPSCNIQNQYYGNCRNCGHWQPRKLLSPGSGKDQWICPSCNIQNQHHGHCSNCGHIGELPRGSGKDRPIDIKLSIYWRSAIRGLACIIGAPIIFLAFVFILSDRLVDRLADWLHSSSRKSRMHRLMQENEELRASNNELLKQIGQKGEYR
jgi:hypothetical protein